MSANNNVYRNWKILMCFYKYRVRAVMSDIKKQRKIYGGSDN